jgi:hypothetical protein
MAQLRQTGAGERSAQLAGALRILFKLEDAAQPPAESHAEIPAETPADPGRPGEPGA